VNFVKLFLPRTPGPDGLPGEIRSIVENIKKFAYSGNDNNIYHVQVLKKETEVELRFVDYGKALNDQLFAGAKRVVDRFEIKPHPRGGNIISLTKRLS
jgi:anti-sigma regulatory factor (Ser/Thr protein kinase)